MKNTDKCDSESHKRKIKKINLIERNFVDYIHRCYEYCFVRRCL